VAQTKTKIIRLFSNNKNDDELKIISGPLIALKLIKVSSNPEIFSLTEKGKAVIPTVY